MTEKIETVARNMRLTDNVREYVEKKATKLERHLQEIDEIRVELSHIKSARSAQDRQVAQITVHGKGFLLRTEERADDIHAAFDAAIFVKCPARIAERDPGKWSIPAARYARPKAGFQGGSMRWG